MQGWLSLGIAAILVSCSTGPDTPVAVTVPNGQQAASAGPGYPPGSAVWSQEERDVYRTAFLTGLQDQRGGIRYEEDQGASQLEGRKSSLYRQGYRKGYYHDAAVKRTREREEAAAPPVSPPAPVREPAPPPPEGLEY